MRKASQFPSRHTVTRKVGAYVGPRPCILIVYMSASTTIRVSTETRDLLKALGARRGDSVGEVVAELVRAADDDLLLADAEASFRRMAGDPGTLAAYRSEALEIGTGFEAPAPDW